MTYFTTQIDRLSFEDARKWIRSLNLDKLNLTKHEKFTSNQAHLFLTQFFTFLEKYKSHIQITLISKFNLNLQTDDSLVIIKHAKSKTIIEIKPTHSQDIYPYFKMNLLECKEAVTLLEKHNADNFPLLEFIKDHLQTGLWYYVKSCSNNITITFKCVGIEFSFTYLIR